ncbi:MAG: TolC family protein, partial [Verrucomicrobia bacterium]|nr:TolC family protein [Verrucomicrobiota bacterium]
LLGQVSGSIPRAGNLGGQTVPPEVPAVLPSAVLERRPDLLQAEQLLRSAGAQVGLAVGDFFPRIGLTALLGGVSTELSALTAPGSQLWSAGLDASGPLFQAGFLYGRYRQARAAWNEAKLEYQATTLRAFHEVSGALFTRVQYEEAHAHQARSVAAYQDAVQVATTRYRSGHANYFEVLDSQQQLFPQENALARIRLNQLLVIVRLYKALGGGWNQPEIPSPAK